MNNKQFNTFNIQVYEHKQQILSKQITEVRGRNPIYLACCVQFYPGTALPVKLREKGSVWGQQCHPSTPVSQLNHMENVAFGIRLKKA